MNSNWSYSPETVKLGCDLCDLDHWPLTLTFCMDLTLVLGDNSWKLYDDGNIVKKVWQADRKYHSQSCLAAAKNNRAPLLWCFKLCASFHSHWWIQTKVTVRKRSIRVKISDLLSPVTLKFNGWPWKTIGHLLYVASSFMHDFIAIRRFNLSYSPETLN